MLLSKAMYRGVLKVGLLISLICSTVEVYPSLPHLISVPLQKMMLSFHEEVEGLPETFLSNFPSLIKVDVHAKVTDPSVAKSMMGCLLSSIKANGGWCP